MVVLKRLNDKYKLTNRATAKHPNTLDTVDLRTLGIYGRGDSHHLSLGDDGVAMRVGSALIERVVEALDDPLLGKGYADALSPESVVKLRAIKAATSDEQVDTLRRDLLAILPSPETPIPARYLPRNGPSAAERGLTEEQTCNERLSMSFRHEREIDADCPPGCLHSEQEEGA